VDEEVDDLVGEARDLTDLVSLARAMDLAAATLWAALQAQEGEP